MSRRTAKFAAASVLAAGLVSVTTPAAQAAPGDCLEWEFGGPTAINVTGNFVPPDNDGFNLTFVATGKTVDRPATMDSVPILGSTNGTMKGGINGTGVSLSFTSNQQNPVTIPLNGTIGPDGVASGGTGAPFEGGAWRTSAPLKCAKKEEAAPTKCPEGSVKPEVIAPEVCAPPKDAVRMTIGGGALQRTVTVTNTGPLGGTCAYDAKATSGIFAPGLNRQIDVGPNASTSIDIPAPPLGSTYHVTLKCTGTYDGRQVQFGQAEQDVSSF